MRASTRTSKKPAHRAGGVGDAVPRVLGSAQTLGAGAIHLPRAGPIPPRPQGPRKAMLSWGPPTSGIEKSAATPRIWVEAASSSLTHASSGTRVSGTAWVRRHKRFGATPKPWRRRIHSARACPIGRRINQKRRTSKWMLSFFGASDEARTRYLHLGKVALYQMSYTRRSVVEIPQRVVPRAGIEPATRGFSVRCSTN